VGKLCEALRKKYPTPLDAIHALGLDENLIARENLMAATTKLPSKFANFAMQLTANALAPVLAKDAKIDLMPIFKDVTSKSFKAKTVKLALDSALKGKLAVDAEAGMGHVAQMLDHIEHVSGEGRDESVSPEQHKAMEAAAHGKSEIGIPKKVGEEFADADKKKAEDEENEKKTGGLKEFLRGKGMSEDDIMGACDALGLGTARMPGGAGDATPAEKKDESEGTSLADREKKEREEKEAADKKAKDAEMEKNMVSKTAMDEAIKVASAATAKSVRETERGVRLALDEVKPWVGELKSDMAFDSAADVYRHALEMKGVDGAKTMHADALRPVLLNLPKPGADTQRTESREALAMDEDTVSDRNKMFPGLDRIKAA
jgi:hypothetical protein